MLDVSCNAKILSLIALSLWSELWPKLSLPRTRVARDARMAEFEFKAHILKMKVWLWISKIWIETRTVKVRWRRRIAIEESKSLPLPVPCLLCSRKLWQLSVSDRYLSSSPTLETECLSLPIQKVVVAVFEKIRSPGSVRFEMERIERGEEVERRLSFLSHSHSPSLFIFSLFDYYNIP